MNIVQERAIQSKFSTHDNISETQITTAISDSVAGEFERPAHMAFPAHMTDTGNATRLITAYGAGLRYCWPSRRWYVWDGARWKEDNTGRIHRRAQETVRLMFIGAGGTSEGGVIDHDMAKFALKSESVRALRAMVELAQSEPGVPVLPEELDADIWNLNTVKGVVNLKTGELRDHRKSDLCTKLAPVIFDAEATCPRWETFLDRIMGGNQNLIDFLQRAIGYSLTGDVSERVLFVLYGLGANGKTTLTEIVRAMLGDYALKIATEVLLAKRADSGASPDIARLKGSRFATASESDEGRRLAEALVKDLTGNETITARRLYAEPFDFQPEFKMWFGTNHKPIIRGTDQAIWDRLKLIPFKVRIPEDEQDKHLLDKLKDELPGILSWAIRGCLAWQEAGLQIPEAVTSATAGYREEMDILGNFFSEKCVTSDTFQSASKDLYVAYTTWCEDNGDRPISNRGLGLALRERGFTKAKKHGRIVWLGVGLAVNEETGDLRDLRDPFP